MVRYALRQRRELQGFTQERLAQALGVETSTYRDWEAGRARPRVGRRPRLARLLDVSLAEINQLLDGDSQPLNGHTVPVWLGHLASLEQAAAEIRAFEPIVVHGLLQTADYASVVERVGSSREDHVAETVSVRIARQAVLDRNPDPLRLTVVLDESVLRRVAGSPAVMAGQLEHLAERAALPNITVQVTPLSEAVFPAAFGAFSLLTSPGADRPFMAYVKDGTGPHYLDRPHYLDHHLDLFDYLSDVALSPDESADLIRRIAKEHR